LSRLAGIAVSTKQVYRLAEQKRGPIRSDRERWTVCASSDALRDWWATSHFPRTFGKRLLSMALGAHGAPVTKRKLIKAHANVGKSGELQVIGTIGQAPLTNAVFLEAVKQLGDVKTIRVLVNSPGGLVHEGLGIYHALRQSKARIEIEIIGVAASMASCIAMAGAKISMAEDGLFMLHDPWGAGVVGNADDLRAAAEVLEKYGESMAGIYARRTKYTEDQILEMMGRNGGEGTWLNATEALAAGFIDEILAPAQARLPIIPAAALAKRITKGNKGAPTVKKLAAKLAALIAAMIKADTTKEDVIDDLAVESELTVDKVTEIVEGKAFPTLAQLRAFADVLGSTTKELRPLAEADGHTFAAKKPAAAATVPALGQVTDVAAAVQTALAAERARVITIEAVGRQHGVPTDAIATIVATAVDVPAGNAAILAWLADPKNKPRINGTNPGVTLNADEHDKRMDGLSQWLLIKAGSRSLVEAHTKKMTGQIKRLDPGQFRGLRLIDIARDVLERDGISLRGLSPMDIAKRALAPRAAGGPGLGTRSDFPVLLENVLHKMLLAAYELAPDKWRMVAATGSVQDFRDHPRLKLGSLPRLSALLESGEFAQMHFPDGEKETIKATTFGNIIGLTRQAIVNDDVDGFSRLVTMLGRAAARGIEIDLFALFALNAGLGPTMGDGLELFDAGHSNIDTTAGLPSIERLEAGRILMAQQMDPNNQDFLDLRPAVWVGPIGQGAAVRVAVAAEFDFDAETTATTGKFMKPNVVRDLLSTIVDTPRLSGDRWYLLADPAVAPVFEVVFLEGEESPVIEVEEGFDYDGVRWSIRHDYGVGATDWRGATTNAGS
jgi:ATP-dependent protease ClpP protease subunit